MKKLSAAIGPQSTSSAATPPTAYGPSAIYSAPSASMSGVMLGCVASSLTTVKIVGLIWGVRKMDKMQKKLIIAMCLSGAGLVLSITALLIKILGG